MQHIHISYINICYRTQICICYKEFPKVTMKSEVNVHKSHKITL